MATSSGTDVFPVPRAGGACRGFATLRPALQRQAAARRRRNALRARVWRDARSARAGLGAALAGLVSPLVPGGSVPLSLGPAPRHVAEGALGSPSPASTPSAPHDDAKAQESLEPPTQASCLSAPFDRTEGVLAPLTLGPRTLPSPSAPCDGVEDPAEPSTPASPSAPGDAATGLEDPPTPGPSSSALLSDSWIGTSDLALQPPDFEVRAPARSKRMRRRRPRARLAGVSQGDRGALAQQREDVTAMLRATLVQ